MPRRATTVLPPVAHYQVITGLGRAMDVYA